MVCNVGRVEAKTLVLAFLVRLALGVATAAVAAEVVCIRRHRSRAAVLLIVVVVI